MNKTTLWAYYLEFFSDVAGSLLGERAEGLCWEVDVSVTCEDTTGK